MSGFLVRGSGWTVGTVDVDNPGYHMSVQSAISERLWSAIQKHYDDANFKGAILEATYLLSDAIREKSGLNSDGVSLAGQAFGGTNPPLKLNKLQSESDKNIQDGMLCLTKGIYQAVRNPRSHGSIVDSQQDADAIISFIDYLLRQIGQSKSPFTIEAARSRVFDTAFVKTERYAKLLVDEIPAKRRLEVLMDSFRSKIDHFSEQLRLFIKELLPTLQPNEEAEFFGYVSDELRNPDSGNEAVRLTLAILPPESLEKLTEAARLRMEHKVIESIKEGNYVPEVDRCISGVLGLSAVDRYQWFLSKDHLVQVLLSKLKSPTRNYVLHYFKNVIEVLQDPPGPYFRSLIISALKEGDVEVYKWLDFFPPDSWEEPFKEAMKGFVPAPPTTDPPPDDEAPES